jgi:ABC-2 family transporter
MGIRKQGYRHWEGEYTSHAFRWWTVAKQAMRATVYSKMRLVGLLLFIMLVWAFYFFYGIFWFFGGASGGDELFFSFTQCPDADCTLRQNLYDTVRAWQILFVPIFVGMVAAPLVSNDLRSNAPYIYLSKPLLRRDYILGKLVAVCIMALPVTVLPNLFVWLMAMGSRDRFTKLNHPYEILFEMLFVQLIILLVIGFLFLAASSLTKKWWVAFAGITGGYYLLFIVSNMLQNMLPRTPGFQQARDWLLASPATNIINFAKAIYERPAGPPSWELSLVILLLLIGGSLSLFLWKMLSLEVAE